MKVYILETYSSDGYDEWGRHSEVYSSKDAALLSALEQEKEFYEDEEYCGDTFHYNIYERDLK